MTTEPHYTSLDALPAILCDIRAFCSRHSISPTRFGALAVNDTALVLKIERGRRLWPETESRIRAFMEGYVPV